MASADFAQGYCTYGEVSAVYSPANRVEQWLYLYHLILKRQNGYAMAFVFNLFNFQNDDNVNSSAIICK